MIGNFGEISYHIKKATISLEYPNGYIYRYDSPYKFMFNYLTILLAQ